MQLKMETDRRQHPWSQKEAQPTEMNGNSNKSNMGKNFSPE